MLIEAAVHFPTVVFTIGLGIALVYWVFVLLGALDLDIGADADAPDVGDVGGDAGDGGGDAGDTTDAAKGAVSTGSIWSGLGLSRVPITISISMILLVCWILSLLAVAYLPGVLGDAAWVEAAILPASLIVGMPIAGVLVRPLGRVFSMNEGKSNQDYVGHVCTITTGHVDENFGQGTVEDGGTVLVIPVRCDRIGSLRRNDKALIIDFDTDRQAYVVEPVADMLPPARDEGTGAA